MKRFWKVVGIATVVVILGLAAVGAMAFAQEDGEGFPFDFRAKFKEAIADILDITVEEYDAAVEQAQGQVVDEALTEGWLTEDQADRMRERFDEGSGMRGMGKGFISPKRGFMGPMGDSPLSLAAEELDMTISDLRAELEDGKSIADVAEAKGVDPQVIADAYAAQLEENLAQVVENGKITQNQADWMLDQAKERVLDLLNNTFEGRVPGGFPGGGRPGRMWGLPDESDV
jgi:polyhydroxyalkanoate synthesis regulator phasin